MANFQHIGIAIAEVRGGLQWRSLFVELADRRKAHGEKRYERAAEDYTSRFCRHQGLSRRVRKETAAGIRVYLECRECGITFGQAIALRSIPNPNSLPLHDPAKAEAMQSYRKEHADNVAQARQSVWQAEEEKIDDEWWALYDEYLGSPAWASIRSRVVDRAHGRCEGCRNAGIDHVHHLTYDRVGWELLYDLVALCRDCHDRAHGKFEK